MDYLPIDGLNFPLVDHVGGFSQIRSNELLALVCPVTSGRAQTKPTKVGHKPQP